MTHKGVCLQAFLSTVQLMSIQKTVTLIDMSNLGLLPRVVRPFEQQDMLESRKMWRDVTEALLEKDYPLATNRKQQIEQEQRDLAAQRQARNEECVTPEAHTLIMLMRYRFSAVYFDLATPDGRPKLTEQGEAALREEMK